MKKLLLFSILLALVACSPKVIAPTQADADRSKGTSLTELQRGHELYTAHCGSCHGLKSPTEYGASSWERIVPDMVKKVNKKAGTTALSSTDETLIRQYVLAMCTK